MEQILLTALVMAMYGTANFIMKLVGMNLDSSSGTLAIVLGYTVAGTTVGLVYGGTVGWSVGYVLAGLVGAFYIIGNWAFLRLSRTEDLSVIAPLAALSVVVPVVLGVLLLGEPVTIRKTLGILAALGAGYLLSGQS